ncbi:histone-like nucleoid-structuring protein Lsr2 [Isoptericola sp. b515]|uniref:tyrosine-type recombinase/integrase n=1 Tax=Isoptericola sp. b515 TaxID=3064652 RepID=UPI0027140A2D|nr:histone-like nucleoid-structuring protein Lsr2 [Isoptericola sp. b515]MDO8147351.1 histone-like nucleoid-structuring protein Lsr2 [Isoptericola sp. b515]
MAARKQRRQSPGTGGVRRLPSGRWQARHTGPDGKMRSIGTFATKTEADTARARQIVSVQDGRWRSPEEAGLPLGAFLRSWLENRTDVSARTRSLNERLFATWIAQPHGRMPMALADLPLGSINQATIRQWHSVVSAEAERRAHDRARRAANSPQAVNRAIRTWARQSGMVVADTGRIPTEILHAWHQRMGTDVELPYEVDANAGTTEPAQAYRLLHAAFQRAIDDGLIRANPCTIKGAGQRDSRNRRERIPANYEEAKALAAAMPDRYRAAVVVTMLTGLRAGELFALQRKHVDLGAGTIRVEQSLAQETSGRWFAPTKSATSRRTVDLPAAAVEVLRVHLETYVPVDKRSLIFATSTGTPLQSGSRSRMFRRARSSIGRDDLTWHDLRHSAMVLWAKTGASLAELMVIAGHSSSKSAMHYQHVVSGAQQGLARKLDHLVASDDAQPTGRPVSRLHAA